jgi:hypothetical protein
MPQYFKKAKPLLTSPINRLNIMILLAFEFLSKVFLVSLPAASKLMASI